MGLELELSRLPVAGRMQGPLFEARRVGEGWGCMVSLHRSAAEDGVEESL